MDENLGVAIEKISKHGVNVGLRKFDVKFVWASDLSTYWKMTSEPSSGPLDPDWSFCPYCSSTWKNRERNGAQKDWKCQWKCFTGSNEFVFCSIHADMRGTEKMLQITFLVAHARGMFNSIILLTVNRF